MKRIISIIVGMSALLLAMDSAFAQAGQPFIHDPSTIVKCDGKYYTFGTGSGGLISKGLAFGLKALTAPPLC